MPLSHQRHLKSLRYVKDLSEIDKIYECLGPGEYC